MVAEDYYENRKNAHEIAAAYEGDSFIFYGDEAAQAYRMNHIGAHHLIRLGMEGAGRKKDYFALNVAPTCITGMTRLLLPYALSALC